MRAVIKQEIIDLLISWNHNSGFNVHVGGRISDSNVKAIESVARYMSRSYPQIESNTTLNQGQSPSMKKNRISPETLKSIPLMSSLPCLPLISQSLMKVVHITMVFIHPAISEVLAPFWRISPPKAMLAEARKMTNRADVIVLFMIVSIIVND